MDNFITNTIHMLDKKNNMFKASLKNYSNHFLNHKRELIHEPHLSLWKINIHNSNSKLQITKFLWSFKASLKHEKVLHYSHKVHIWNYHFTPKVKSFDFSLLEFISRLLMLKHHETIIIRANNIIKVIIRTNKDRKSVV